MSIVTSTSPLAVHGGARTVERPFQRFSTIGAEEAAAVRAVIDTGVLSQFLGAWHDDFYGGPRVREFEERWKSHFGVGHAVTVNSATSGLIAAAGAIGLEPGDEVIVPPWTMSATATAVLFWNAIPVFADIEPRTFCLDPRSVEANITPHTRAIFAVDIFGQSADVDALMAIAAKHGLAVVSDTAQAPGARVGERYAGTLAHVGCYSLNYHKHIHTGEGGVIVTNDPDLTDRMQLIRNHAEAVVGAKGTSSLANMLGYNFRLGEIECAIGLAQLDKLSAIVESRQRAAARLTEGLAGLPGLQTPAVRPGSTHVYYIYPLILDSAELGVSRASIKAALDAEGVSGLIAGYQNIHRFPLYQQKIAYGSSGFPWTIAHRDVDYRVGICPTAERLHDETFLGLLFCMYEFTDAQVDAVIAAFHKVWANLAWLR